MSERKTNPTIVPKITRPGESLQKTGSRRVSELLPDILQTTVNKQFFDSTLEQLMSSGSLESVKHFVGKTVGDSKFTPSLDDSYLIDNRSNDTYQFTPGMVNKKDDGSKQNKPEEILQSPIEAMMSDPNRKSRKLVYG